ncbi:hypothetical protein D3C76_1555180 [compost metagenome]
MPTIRRRPAAKLRVHGGATHFHGDLDGLLPVVHRCPAFVFVGAGPTIHRQQRGQLQIVVAQGFLELGDTFLVGARADPPGQEVFPWRQLQVLVAKFGGLAAQVRQAQVAMHVGVEGDFHCCSP